MKGFTWSKVSTRPLKKDNLENKNFYVNNLNKKQFLVMIKCMLIIKFPEFLFKNPVTEHLITFDNCLNLMESF